MYILSDYFKCKLKIVIVMEYYDVEVDVFGVKNLLGVWNKVKVGYLWNRGLLLWMLLSCLIGYGKLI